MTNSAIANMTNIRFVNFFFFWLFIECLAVLTECDDFISLSIVRDVPFVPPRGSWRLLRHRAIL